MDLGLEMSETAVSESIDPIVWHPPTISITGNHT